MLKSRKWLFAVALVVACSEGPTQPSTREELRPRLQPAPLYLAVNRAPGTLPERYIVVVNDDFHDAIGLSKELGRALGFKADVAWNTGFRFFAGYIPANAVEGIRHDPRVKYVEEDQKAQLTDTYPNPPSWGLDRIDQAHLPLNNTYQDYLGGNTTLVTVYAYIIDTGIRYSHVEFEGRAIPGFDYDSINHPRGSSSFAVDCFHHGTHVAGTVGGKTVGVSKRVVLYGVRVFDCNGGTDQFNSFIISGVNWVTANALRPAVANMSLRSPADQALDDAVRTSINAGITYVVSAGNDNGANACNYSPARVAEAITVGSTDSNDQRSSFSNSGTCVDLFAPGRDILSAGIASDTELRLDSGTSMSAPHVTGVVANLIAWSQDPNNPSSVQTSVINYQSTPGVVINPGSGSPNRLLNSIYPFTLLMTGPVSVSCGGSGTYAMQGAGGVGPYSNFHGYLSHTYGDQYKTFSGTTFVENAPIDGSTQNMLVVGQANDARGTPTEVDYATFMCEYF